MTTLSVGSQDQLDGMDKDANEKFSPYNITPIITDATYFIYQLKKILIELEIMMDDSIFKRIAELLDAVSDVHITIAEQLSIIKYPSVLFTLCYQDGLIHSFQRIKSGKMSGDYSNYHFVKSVIDPLKQLRRVKLQNKIYEDVAYLDGYINGFSYLLKDNEDFDDPPIYFIMGNRNHIEDHDKYLELIKGKKIFHKSAHKYALKLIDRLQISSSGTIFHHKPFL